MKRFCSQCGKELGKNILICPKCGFKNKKKRSKKILIILISISVIFVTLGFLVYIFRDQIIPVIKDPIEFITSMQDPDYKAKQEYKSVYERYLVEIRYYNLTTGYQKHYDKEDESIANKLIEERKIKIENMDEINCFGKINLDTNCDNLLKELRDTEKEISNLISNDFYFPPYDCKICQTQLEDLLRIVGTVKSAELSDLLFALTNDLKEFNSIELQAVEIRTNDPSQYGMSDGWYYIERYDNDNLRKEFVNKFNEQVSLINGALGLNLSKIQ